MKQLKLQPRMERIYFEDNEITPYLVTDDGRIWSDKTKRYLKPYVSSNTSKNPYMKVTLHDADGCSHGFPVHQLVAIFYLPNPLGATRIRHIDGDNSNNHVSNLEWIIPKK